MAIPGLTPQQQGLADELTQALPREPAVINWVVRWALKLVATEREACAAIAEDHLLWVHQDACYEEIAAKIRARS